MTRPRIGGETTAAARKAQSYLRLAELFSATMAEFYEGGGQTNNRSCEHRRLRPPKVVSPPNQRVRTQLYLRTYLYTSEPASSKGWRDSPVLAQCAVRQSSRRTFTSRLSASWRM